MARQKDIQPLVIDRISKYYSVGEEKVTGLIDVELKIQAGEFLAVTGPSGSGKSTLLHCASGLDSVDSGQILLTGIDITKLNDRKLTEMRRESVGFIFQAYNLISSKTALENILYPLRLRRCREDTAWLEEVVEILGIGNLLERFPSQMSGGQQQRVAIARSMLSRPQIVFADEPTGALDSETSSQLLELFVYCTKQLGQSIMMVTHDHDAANRADRIVRMLDGRIEGIEIPRSQHFTSTEGDIS
ncbi:ABC transporter ATP-binding protein [Corynebacterium sp. CCM 9203]|uniref:ABC transporter ATP-binding protein n=1 Tax=Corynebacterium sp. CCM 9203 TaxID=3057615 RepID=UPI003524522E